MTGRAWLCAASSQVALDAAGIEVAVEARDQKHRIDVCRDDLLVGRFAGALSRELSQSRQYGFDERPVARIVDSERDPVADRRQFAPALSEVFHAAGGFGQPLAGFGDHAIHVVVLEGDPAGQDIRRRMLREGLGEVIVPA